MSRDGFPQPAPPDASWPRYSSRPFPPYTHVPGTTPHPRRDPQGHSHGLPEPHLPPWAPADWRANAEYLYGIDCHNFARWWECHEALEALWHAAGRTTPPAQFLQGIIQVAAGNLQRFLGHDATGRGLAEKGLERMKGVPNLFMGVDIAAFDRDVRAYFDERRDSPALIRLAGADGK